MSLFAQLTFNGLIAGSIYALVASGFSLIYKTNKIMHFAHGAMVAVAAYITYFLFSLIGINFYLSFLLTLIVSGAIGYLMYFGIYFPLQKKGVLPTKEVMWNKSPKTPNLASPFILVNLTFAPCFFLFSPCSLRSCESIIL